MTPGGAGFRAPQMSAPNEPSPNPGVERRDFDRFSRRIGCPRITLPGRAVRWQLKRAAMTALVRAPLGPPLFRVSMPAESDRFGEPCRT